MSEVLPGLENYLKCNGLPRVILDICIKHLDDKSKSISQVQHLIYDLLDSQGIDEVKVTCFADEIIDWYISEIPETTININRIAQYAIDNDHHPSAMDRLMDCDLSCLDDDVRSSILNN